MRTELSLNQITSNRIKEIHGTYEIAVNQEGKVTIEYDEY